MGEKGHLWLEFRPNPFSTFGDQVSPQAKKPRACQSTLRASLRVISEPAQIPVLAKLLSSQPDVDDEMGFRKHLRRIVSFLSDLDDASDFLRAAVCFIRSTSSTRADRHNQLAARSATGGSTATAARASKCILALIGFSIIGPLTAPLRMTACSQVRGHCILLDSIPLPITPAWRGGCQWWPFPEGWRFWSVSVSAVRVSTRELVRAAVVVNVCEV